jgi:hypothetical protein
MLWPVQHHKVALWCGANTVDQLSVYVSTALLALPGMTTSPVGHAVVLGHASRAIST